MKYFRLRVAVVFVVLGALLSAALFDATPSSGQSPTGAESRRGGESQVKPTVLGKKRSAVTKADSALASAAARNALLSSELNWTFGNKPQRGWYLYTPLIKGLLAVNHEPGSERFAAALARWQKKSGLSPSGVLDEESLYAMVSYWQGRRIKDRTPALPEALTTAPASDFFYPERLPELRQVERATYRAYERMVSAAVADRSLGLAAGPRRQLAANEKYLKIISSFRSREYQEKLRRESPQAGSAGLAVNSPHFTGRALDLYVGGEAVDTNDANRALQVQTRVYQWLVRNAQRFGFRPYFYEPWHWEYVKEAKGRKRKAVGSKQ